MRNSPGQIAFESWNGHPPRGAAVWETSPNKQAWEAAAQAVIAEHERRKAEQVKPDPFAAEKAAFAAGKVIQSYSTMGREWVDLPNPTWGAPPHTYRVKPDPVMVPLYADDVKCGQRIKHKSFDVSIESMICGVFGDGVARVQWSTGGVSMVIVKWGELKREWSIDRNDGKGWVACSKEVQP